MDSLVSALWDLGRGIYEIQARTKVTGLAGSADYYSARSKRRRRIWLGVAIVFSAALLVLEFIR